MRVLKCLVLLAVLSLSSALAGDISLEWDSYTDVADGLNLYRAPSAEDGGVVLVWTLVNSTPLPITDTTFTDTAVAGWYCWRVRTVTSGVESGGSNINCDEVIRAEVTGLR